MSQILKPIRAFLFLVIVLAPDLSAQDAPRDTLRNYALKIYLDCRSCDMNYTREEIPYVNYVRDVHEAQVFILVTTQSAGNKGSQFTYKFIGQKDFDGMSDTLTYTSNPDETISEIREKRTNLLKLGLMRYVARTPLSNEIIISHNEDLRAEEVEDKWDYWVFEISTSPRFNAEESFKRFFLSNSLEISRITPEMKLEIEVDQSTNKQTYKNDDGTSTVYLREQESLRTLAVKSFGEHWSAGIILNMESATNPNYDFNLEAMPAIEYNLYPYSIATHKQLRINYSLGTQYCNYIDSTIYNKLEETLYRQNLRVAYQVQEKWGSVNISLTVSNYFHNFSKNQVQLDGFIRLRILKGLSLSVNGGVAYINDQLNLRKGDLTEAERLLRLKEQATNYELQGGLSIMYTFGSIYNNVVNPRFGSGGGGGGGGGMGGGGGGFF